MVRETVGGIAPVRAEEEPEAARAGGRATPTTTTSAVTNTAVVRDARSRIPALERLDAGNGFKPPVPPARSRGIVPPGSGGPVRP